MTSQGIETSRIFLKLKYICIIKFNIVSKNHLQCYFLDLTEPYKYARADFKQRNLEGLQISGAEGERMKNLNFVFSWIDSNLRKMVLTSNDGRLLKNGYMKVSESMEEEWNSFNMQMESKWKDPVNWKDTDLGFYTVTNFRASRGK